MAIWGALIGAAASAYGSYASNQTAANAAANANTSNLDMFNASQLYNAQQATFARDWQAQQADWDRSYNAQQAQLGRDFATSAQTAAQDFNSAEAQKNRDFQQMMSNTSYQRAVGDMKSAGLNPMLAYSQGGAPMASGSAASAGVVGGPTASHGGGGGASASSGSGPMMQPVQRVTGANLLANTASSFLDIQRKMAEIDAIKTSTKGGELTNEKMQNEAKYTITFLNEALQSKQLDNSQKNIANRMLIETEEVRKKMVKGELTLQEGRIRMQEIQETLQKYEIPGAKNEAAFEDSTLGRTYRFLRETTGLAGSAADVVKPFVKSGDTRPKPGPRSYNETHYDADGNVTRGMSRNYGD